jgi:hypothetical protein
MGKTIKYTSRDLEVRPTKSELKAMKKHDKEIRMVRKHKETDDEHQAN